MKKIKKMFKFHIRTTKLKKKKIQKSGLTIHPADIVSFKYDVIEIMHFLGASTLYRTQIKYLNRKNDVNSNSFWVIWPNQNKRKEKEKRKHPAMGDVMFLKLKLFNK